MGRSPGRSSGTCSPVPNSAPAPAFAVQSHCSPTWQAVRYPAPPTRSFAEASFESPRVCADGRRADHPSGNRWLCLGVRTAIDTTALPCSLGDAFGESVELVSRTALVCPAENVVERQGDRRFAGYASRAPVWRGPKLASHTFRTVWDGGKFDIS
jgi:hypothetical protein